MKPINFFLFIIVISSFYGCFKFLSDDEETVVYEGKIFEAFDKSKPVDSVFVMGCTQEITFFPNWPTCDTLTLTNTSGRFSISFEAGNLESRGFSYGKEGYRSLDSCVTLNDGTLECYIKALSTVFYIYSPTSSKPFTYDSLNVNIKTLTKDTIVKYKTKSYTNSYNGTSYYWSTDTNTSSGSINSTTNIIVTDNSKVSLKADYYINNQLITTDLDTLFCKKGIGNKYKILQ
jgi:hypothetical protein